MKTSKFNGILRYDSGFFGVRIRAYARRATCYPFGVDGERPPAVSRRGTASERAPVHSTIEKKQETSMTKNFRPVLSALFVGTLGALFATGAAADVTV